ncbi:hypothetical protein HS088_TW06G01054 [Tripterygium wilfordii]|uniref:Cysteine-rich receptor-like protein kinase 42 n=1 Tax=Tripterygium wilfordii TaxID=458696 RepID=A0A7J7DKP6_TRIWF|nr:hypothetical protein HS088_TW06G01054 [Tripterygium wilfordii]
MQTLSQIVSTNHFVTYSIPDSPLPMFGLIQCHHDLSQTDCLLCYAATRIRLPRCLPSPSAAIFLDGCFLRYDTYSFYNESVSNSLNKVKCGTENATQAGGMGFVRSVEYAVGNVTSIAVENNGFGVVSVERVYALAQCWESVGIDGCRECLKKAGEAAKGCVPRREGRGMNAGCYLRYSTEKFYNDGREAGLHSHGMSGLGIIVAIALASVAFLMLSLFAAYAGYARLSKRKEGHKNLGRFSGSIHKSSPNFKYEILEKATDYFNLSRKIGQGGAGSVYMGTLPDGQTVAVKRLVFNTRQWVDEFFNEVNLISGIQHKNLVKLLGCSIEGPESLLVYEYVPNRSLDQFLFGNWLLFA